MEKYTKTLEEELKKWLEFHVPKAKTSPCYGVHIHLNSLISSDQLMKNDILMTSIEAFQILIRLIGDHIALIKPILEIPLQTVGNKISFQIPRDLDELQLQMDDMEPPSLIIVNRQCSVYFNGGFEKYEIPLSFNPLADFNNNSYSYYSEDRNIAGIENKWEFRRIITIEFYPNEYKSVPR